MRQVYPKAIFHATGMATNLLNNYEMDELSALNGIINDPFSKFSLTFRICVL